MLSCAEERKCAWEDGGIFRDPLGDQGLAIFQKVYIGRNYVKQGFGWELALYVEEILCQVGPKNPLYQN